MVLWMSRVDPSIRIVQMFSSSTVPLLAGSLHLHYLESFFLRTPTTNPWQIGEIV